MPSEATGWAWWFLSLFVGGILVNLISAYVVPAVDRWLSKYFDSVRLRTEKQQRLLDEKVEEMLRDPQEALWVMLSSQNNSLYAYFSSLFSMLVFIGFQIGLLRFGADNFWFRALSFAFLFVFVANVVRGMQRTIQLGRLLREYRRRKGSTKY